jgi:hypothetical protein
MSTPSLTAQIVSGQVDTAIAAQLFSNRIQDSNAMMCPLWTGTDLAGRPVCKDSFYTKNAGCNSALDRIEVEDSLRPRYAEFLLDARGIVGVGADYGNNSAVGRGSVKGPLGESVARRRRGVNLQGGNFGVVLPSEYAGGKSLNQLSVDAANGYQGNPMYSSAQEMAMSAQNRRMAQNLAVGYQMKEAQMYPGSPNVRENYGENNGGTMRYPGGLNPSSRPSGLNPPERRPGGLLPSRPTGLNPPARRPGGLIPSRPTGLNPPARRPGGLLPIPDEPIGDYPAYQDYWLNSMCVPPADERTTWNNYVQVKDICNHSGQRF